MTFEQETFGSAQIEGMLCKSQQAWSVGVLVSDMMEPGGRVFMKSEFGPIGDRWPCFSYTKKNVGQRLRAEFRRDRDIVIYVGTTNPEMTENPDHRSRIISAVSIEPNHILETRKIVPEDEWTATIARYGENPWPYSMAVTNAAVMIGPPFPEARAVTPKTYASFAAIQNRGNIIEALGDEREAVMALPVQQIELHLTEPVQRYMRLMDSVSKTVEKTIKQEAARMAALIEARVKAGGEYTVHQNPTRAAPNQSDLVALFIRKWTIDQKGKCALCRGPLTQTGHKMLKVSADRIDSNNIAYNDVNTQLTHLACNLAKNQWGFDAFKDWLAIVRDVREVELVADDETVSP